MTSEARFERQLPAILEDLYLGPSPDYRDVVLATATARRQRPAWTFPGRWFPMADIASRPAFAPRLPWRAIWVALVIIALLVGAFAALVGSQRRLPPPFGPARNGLVAYAQGGSVYTVDPVSRAIRTVVTGEGVAVDPYFSQDGTKVLFERRGVTNGTLVFAASVDGSNVVQLTPEPLLAIGWYEFSSDGRSVAINHVVDGVPVISIASSDGTSLHTLELGMSAQDVFYRPGTHELIFVTREGGKATGIYLVRDDGSNPRHVLSLSGDMDVPGVPRWSPDGTRIAYDLRESSDGPIRVHVMSADGTGDVVVGHLPGSPFEGWPIWSPDGTRLLIERGMDGVTRPTIVSVNGDAPDVTIDYVIPYWGVAKAWSPDGTFIQVTPQDETGRFLQQVLWNTTTGASTTAPWTASSSPAMQRVAP